MSKSVVSRPRENKRRDRRSPKSTVTVENRHKKYGINTGIIGRVAKKVLKEIGVLTPVSLEILFIGDKEIQKLNRRFKGCDSVTDVLSFGLGDVGSIVISLDTASLNAKTFGALFHEEVARYVIHGILHLFGYDDDTRPHRLKMAGKEDRILRSICANTDLSKALTRL